MPGKAPERQRAVVRRHRYNARFAMHRHRELTALGILFAFVPAARAQDAIRIAAVPERIVLPAPAGSNLLLEVAATGTPEAVWLARDAEQTDRVPLQAVGDQRWQLNLADARVAALLRPDRADGTFHACARFGTKTVQSPPIAWSRAAVPAAQVRALVRLRDGGSRPATADTPRWFDPSATDRIEIHGADAPQARVVARAGTTDCPLVRPKDQQHWVLSLNDGLRASIQQAGTLDIEIRLGAETRSFPFLVVPDRLRAGDGPPEFTIMQRRRGFVPGSRDWLEVRIDDITMGQVLLEMVDAEGATVVAPRHVAERDFVEFALSGERYVLEVRKLVNLLINDDYAEFAVVQAPAFLPDRIAQLIRRVDAATSVTFLREDREYPSTAAAQLLRARLGSHRGPRPTVDQFIDDMASKSSRTGEPYHVRTKDGQVVKVADWLRQELRALEAEDKQAPRR
jgi:hypothetical protein